VIKGVESKVAELISHRLEDEDLLIDLDNLNQARIEHADEDSDEISMQVEEESKAIDVDIREMNSEIQNFQNRYSNTSNMLTEQLQQNLLGTHSND
jgi:cell division septum initiation protein DivIVA